jgi:hypothetical protein
MTVFRRLLKILLVELLKIVKLTLIEYFRDGTSFDMILSR